MARIAVDCRFPWRLGVKSQRGDAGTVLRRDKKVAGLWIENLDKESMVF
jgi:hypothetical protein